MLRVAARRFADEVTRGQEATKSKKVKCEGKEATYGNDDEN
jgi:hypothetical protein